MKKLTFCLIALVCTINLSAQSWQSGTLKLYTSPDTTKVGIGISSPTERLHINNGALKIGNSTAATDRAKNLLKFGDGSYVQIGEWEANDELSFKANKYNFTTGNVGIGVASPQYKLDIDGKLYLRWTDPNSNSWKHSYLHWPGHSLVLGSPEGIYAHNSIDLMPGGATQGVLFSQLCMYNAESPGVHTEKIRFNTMNNCWINTNGNLGIGTSNPQYKLDVIGTIRAREILVNTNGADYVFADNYNLLSLQQVNEFVQANKHLPDIPSAEEMQEQGMAVGEIQTLLLQKIEELTLYIIEQDKRIQELENNLK